MNVLKLMKIINTKLPPYIWAWIAKYKNHEEQTGSGTLVFENTYGQKFSNFEVYGNTAQDGIPTPETTVPINNVTGENKIKVENGNLFDKNDVIEGKCVTNTGELANNNTYNCSNYIEVRPNTTYTLKPCVSANELFTLCQYDENKNFVIYTGIRANEITFTTEATTKYIILNYDKSKIDEVKLEQGSTATDYIPHEEQTVTFPLEEGQYMAKGDYLADNGIHHVRGKYVFTGQETIIKNSESTTSTLYYINKSLNLNFLKDLDFNKADSSLCTHLQYKTMTDIFSNNEEGFNINSATITYINIKTEENTVQAVKNKLTELYNNGTPMVIEYPLATETIEPYTQAQQEAWNAIKELHTYLDYTQISQENDGLSFILKVSVN